MGVEFQDHKRKRRKRLERKMRAFLGELLLLLLLAAIGAYQPRYVQPFPTRLYQEKLNNIDVAQGKLIAANQILYTIKSSSSVESAVKTVQSWATQSRSLFGKSIKVNDTRNGIRFQFIPSPESYLDLSIESVDGTLVVISDLLVKGGDSMQSLIGMSAKNLLDSFVFYMLSTGDKMPPPSAAEDRNDKEKVTKKDERDNQNSMNIPSQEEVNKFWKVQPSPANVPVNIVYKWESSSHAYDTILSSLRLWSKTFAGKGAGITCNITPNNLIFYFAILSDKSYLNVTLESQADDLVLISQTFISLEDGRDTMNIALVNKAATNIINNLKQHLDGVNIESDSVGVRLLDEDITLDDPSIVQEAAKNIPLPPRNKVQVSERKRDPKLYEQGKKIGINLENYENKYGIEEQAMTELTDLVQRISNKDGFLDYLKDTANGTSAAGSAQLELSDLFQKGKEISQMLNRNLNKEDFSIPATTLPINLAAGGLAGGVDIFQDPSVYRNNIENGEIPAPRNSLVGELTAQYKELIPPNPDAVEENTRSLKLLVTELSRQPEEMHSNILDSFTDLMLGDNFLYILKTANETVSDGKTRKVFSKIVSKTAQLTSQLGVLVSRESFRHLETIREICEISALYQHDEAEFTDRMRVVKPKFDTDLLSFIKYKINEEVENISKNGGDAYNSPSSWLQVLQVVYKGILSDFEHRYDRLLEPLLLVVRFDEPDIRTKLLIEFIEITPVVDLHILRALAFNMIKSVITDESTSKSVGADIRESLLQLHEDISKYLSDDIIAAKLSPLQKDASKQGMVMELRNRNPFVSLPVYDDKNFYISDSILTKKDGSEDASTERDGPSRDPGSFHLGL